MHKAQRLINHVALVLDGSSSMSPHAANLVKVADAQIKHLAAKSEEMSQETRVSVYLFGYNVRCLIFDMDVMRLPSIAELYHANGMTALIDAAIQSQEDLETTSQIYGDHAFLTFVLTDGQENYSKKSASVLTRKLKNASENWTTAFLVPDRAGSKYVADLGVYDGNIAIWNTTSAAGLNEAVSQIRQATDNFMTGRVQGLRGSRSVFSTGTDAVNKQTVSATLTPVDPSRFRVYPVIVEDRIDEFVKAQIGTYIRGNAYYELTKTETIQAQKGVVVFEKKTGKVYSGADARHLIGLPDGESVRVKPDANPDYTVFIQSTSINRKLVPNTKLFVLR